MDKSLLSVALKRKASRTPIWFMRQAGRHLPEYRAIRSKYTEMNFLDLCYNSDLAAEITLQPTKRYDIDAAIVFSDILVVLDAIGYNVQFIDNIGPRIDHMDLSKINLEMAYNKFAKIAKTIILVKQNISDHMTMIGFCGGAFTVALYALTGGIITNASEILYNTEDQYLDQLIQILINVHIEYLCTQIKAGAEVIQIFESHAHYASNERHFERFIIEPNRKIINAIKARYPSMPIILFAKGAGMFYPQIMKLNHNVLSVEATIPDSWINEQQRNGLIVQGNLDNMLLCYGNKEDIIKRTNDIMNRYSQRPFIFNLSHGILKETKIENIESVINTVRQHNNANM